MGVALTWVAIKSSSFDDVYARLSLAPTAQRCEYPFKGIAGHQLPDSWLLVAAGSCGHRIAARPTLAGLSAGCMVVACNIEEHVNFASVEYWQNGACLWSVVHEGEEDPEDLSITGRVPQRLHELLASVEDPDSENLDGHFHMDIPLMLAQEVCGYRHDGTNPVIDESRFVILDDLAPKKAWWKLWN